MTSRELLLSRIPESKLAEWLEKYRDIFIVESGEYAYMCRPISYASLMLIDKFGGDDSAKEDAICAECVLYPPIENVNNLPAGIPTAIARSVLERSCFLSEKYAEEILKEFREDMKKAINQFIAVTAYAFKIDMEELEEWPINKLIKYYTRAEWILQQIYGGGEQSTRQEGSIEDFPELKAEQAFLSGKLHPKKG